MPDSCDVKKKVMKKIEKNRFIRPLRAHRTALGRIYAKIKTFFNPLTTNHLQAYPDFRPCDDYLFAS